MPHHQHVAEAARIFPERFHLFEDLIRRAGKYVTARHLLFQGRPRRDARSCDAAHHVGRYSGRVIARRITPLRWHLVGFHIPQQLACTFFGLALVLADIAEAEICQPIERRVFAMGFKIALAIAVENFADARVACKKDRANVLVLRYRSRGTITAHSDPNRRVRLLIRTGPDVDLAMVVPFTFKVEGTVMGGPGLQD